ncbi:hypothetical protein EU537_05895 [Candidatus Thorarchaeota archaeon]|nr:MAG: hypothetical protein EU537_05895 [Candidatus Thorarchaeota archaeon]
MKKKEIGILSALFLLVPFAIILLYYWGAFRETGILPLPPTQSASLLIVTSILLFLSFCYFSGKLNILRSSTSITKEQDGKIARVVKNPATGDEYFLRAEPDKILRNVLEEQWPFDEIDPKSAWYVVDEGGNKITDDQLSVFEGTAKIILEDE